MKTTERSQTKLLTIRWLPVIGLTISAGLFLLSHYALGAWAEVSEAHHVVQHVLIFLAGLGVGVSGFSLRSNDKTE